MPLFVRPSGLQHCTIIGKEHLIYLPMAVSNVPMHTAVGKWFHHPPAASRRIVRLVKAALEIVAFCQLQCAVRQFERRPRPRRSASVSTTPQIDSHSTRPRLYFRPLSNPLFFYFLPLYPLRLFVCLQLTTIPLTFNTFFLSGPLVHPKRAIPSLPSQSLNIKSHISTLFSPKTLQ